MYHMGPYERKEGSREQKGSGRDLTGDAPAGLKHGANEYRCPREAGKTKEVNSFLKPQRNLTLLAPLGLLTFRATKFLFSKPLN